MIEIIVAFIAGLFIGGIILKERNVRTVGGQSKNEGKKIDSAKSLATKFFKPSTITTTVHEEKREIPQEILEKALSLLRAGEREKAELFLQDSLSIENELSKVILKTLESSGLKFRVNN